MSPLLYLVTSRMFKDIDRTGLIEMSGDGSVAGGYPPIWEMGNTCNYLIIWVQIYEKEIIQTNNSAKNEKIQRNNSPKFEKIQRNIIKTCGCGGGRCLFNPSLLMERESNLQRARG